MAKHLKIEDLNKGNVWSLSENDIHQMLLDGKKQENYADNEAHYMNIIRPVFDILYINRADEEKVAELEAQQYDIFSTPNEGENNAIAIKKRQIIRVNDLTLENVAHLMPEEILNLLEKNMGTGWQGLPLAIQDIIESAFYVDCAVLPAYAMHRAGGIVERRKADGYFVLEVPRGNWIEGVFIKPKPKMEKIHFTSLTYNKYGDGDDNDEDLDDDDDDENEEDLIDDDNPDRDEDDDDMMEEEDPEIEDVEIIDDNLDDDEEE